MTVPSEATQLFLHYFSELTDIEKIFERQIIIKIVWKEQDLNPRPLDLKVDSANNWTTATSKENDKCH